MRSVIGITSDSEGNVVVLCSDGTVWRMEADRVYEKVSERFGDGYMVPTNHRWEQVPHGPIPGTEAAATTYPRGKES